MIDSNKFGTVNKARRIAGYGRPLAPIVSRKYLSRILDIRNLYCAIIFGNYSKSSNSCLFYFKGEFSQRGEGSFQIRNRSVRFIPTSSSNIIIGNYDKRFGLGINIGHFSFLNYIRDDTLNASEQFLYPLRARYNGIFIEQRFDYIKASFFYSANRWSHFKNWLLGGDFTWSFRKINLGLT